MAVNCWCIKIWKVWWWGLIYLCMAVWNILILWKLKVWNRCWINMVLMLFLVVCVVMKRNFVLKSEFIFFVIVFIVGIWKISVWSCGIIIMGKLIKVKAFVFFCFLIGLSRIFGNIFGWKILILFCYILLWNVWFWNVMVCWWWLMIIVLICNWVKWLKNGWCVFVCWAVGCWLVWWS